MITTASLVLRRLDLNDAPFIFQLLNTPSWKQYIGERNIKTLADAEGYIEKTKASFNELGFGPWCVTLKPTGEPIGICGLYQRSYLDAPDLGFAILPNYEGKGLAYESCLAALDNVKTNQTFSGLYATTSADNTRSQNLLSRCGFNFLREITTPTGEQLNLYYLRLS